MSFDPEAAFQSLPMPSTSAPVNKHTLLRFVEHQSRKYVIKSFVSSTNPDLAHAEQRFDRERVGAETFSALGTLALQPVYASKAPRCLNIAGEMLEFEMFMVFPFQDVATLDDVIGSGAEAARTAVRDAAQRIGARHLQVTNVMGIHSDGAPHNVFGNWCWFDFSDAHPDTELTAAKANEVWRFICGALASVPTSSLDNELVALFCEHYGDRKVLELVLKTKHRTRPRLRMLAQPIKLVRLWIGDTRQLARLRALISLNTWFTKSRSS